MISPDIQPQVFLRHSDTMTHSPDVTRAEELMPPFYAVARIMPAVYSRAYDVHGGKKKALYEQLVQQDRFSHLFSLPYPLDHPSGLIVAQFDAMRTLYGTTRYEPERCEAYWEKQSKTCSTPKRFLVVGKELHTSPDYPNRPDRIWFYYVGHGSLLVLTQAACEFADHTICYDVNGIYSPTHGYTAGRLRFQSEGAIDNISEAPLTHEWAEKTAHIRAYSQHTQG